MNISLHHGAINHRHSFPNASMVSTNPTGHNGIKYDDNLSEKPNYVAIHSAEVQFDFNKTPHAPPRIKVIVHEKPQQRKT